MKRGRGGRGRQPRGRGGGRARARGNDSPARTPAQGGRRGTRGRGQGRLRSLGSLAGSQGGGGLQRRLQQDMERFLDVRKVRPATLWVFGL